MGESTTFIGPESVQTSEDELYNLVHQTIQSSLQRKVLHGYGNYAAIMEASSAARKSVSERISEELKEAGWKYVHVVLSRHINFNLTWTVSKQKPKSCTLL